jgi:geranylgeranyl diphosphate synthase type II
MKENIQASLVQFVSQLPNSTLKDAALYAIQAGGKRFRPLVILSLLESYGLEASKYVEVATSIEMIHLYSLIHDDLPAMDDDSLRHGVPTVHRQFDEATAILLGDGLLTDAFQRVSGAKILTAEEKVKIITVLSKAAGLSGMVFGQHLDIEHEGKQANLDMLKQISLHKTGKLLEAAFRIGAIISSPKDEDSWGNLGLSLGLMFQIQDDILEVTTSEQDLKKSKSDVALNKATFVSQLGLAAAKQEMETLYASVVKALEKMTLKKPTIVSLINTIYSRRY